MVFRVCDEVKFATFSNEPVCLLTRRRAQGGQEGKIVGVICVGQGITRIKGMEQEEACVMAMIIYERESPLLGIIGLDCRGTAPGPGPIYAAVGVGQDVTTFRGAINEQKRILATCLEDRGRQCAPLRRGRQWQDRRVEWEGRRGPRLVQGRDHGQAIDRGVHHRGLRGQSQDGADAGSGDLRDYPLDSSLLVGLHGESIAGVNKETYIAEWNGWVVTHSGFETEDGLGS